MNATLALTPQTSIRDLLAAKYPAPHWITLFEVRDSTGYDATRSADAIAIGLYRSRGFEIHGFEIKESRTDWLRELKRPEKAEEIGKFCDYFWLVSGCDSIARIDELPAPWGWMVPKGERLKVLKKPEKIKALPVDRPMLCSLLYTLKGKCLAEIQQQIQQAVEDRLKSDHSSLQYQCRDWQDRYQRLRTAVSEFEAASGVSFSSGWCDRPKIGAAVRAVMTNVANLQNYKRDLEELAKRARAFADLFERERKALDDGA